jgi:pimeloyl-ACP methyl ester carboxylesterase
MSKLKINDISVYYEQHGEGEPVVFIPGFSSDHTIWGAVVDSFKAKYQVLLFDNRGSGQTDVPKGPYSIEGMTEDLVALCSQLGINQAHFIGNSMGGFILQTLAYRYPKLVKTATISHSAATIHAPFHIYVDAQLELLKAGAPLESLIKASSSWAFSYQFLTKPGMLQQLVQLTLDNPFPFTETGYEGQYAALDQFDSSAWVNQIKVPTLVLSSDQDLIFREALGRWLSEQIPNARYYCFSDCGHLPQIEYPEKFFEVVDKFISSKPVL